MTWTHPEALGIAHSVKGRTAKLNHSTPDWCATRTAELVTGGNYSGVEVKPGNIRDFAWNLW
jgi:hypothetical protein